MSMTFRLFLTVAVACMGGVSARAAEGAPPPDKHSEQPPSQAQVLEDILKDQPPPSTPAAEDEAKREAPPAPPVKLAELLQAPEAGMGPLEGDGSLVMQARAQLVRVGGERKIPVLVFRAEDRKTPHRPMLVHPNRKLEELETAQAKAGPDAQFVVSGVVETYRGNNYILLKRVAPLRKDDNLE